MTQKNNPQTQKRKGMKGLNDSHISPELLIHKHKPHQQDTSAFPRDRQNAIKGTNSL